MPRTILDIIFHVVGAFCFVTAFCISIVMKKTIERMDENEKVETLLNVIKRPLKALTVLFVAGLIFSVIGFIIR